MRLLFKVLRIIGDAKAASKGRLPQRLTRWAVVRRVRRHIR
jgi:hypothetical protein